MLHGFITADATHGTLVMSRFSDNKCNEEHWWHARAFTALSAAAVTRLIIAIRATLLMYQRYCLASHSACFATSASIAVETVRVWLFSVIRLLVRRHLRDYRNVISIYSMLFDFKVSLHYHFTIAIFERLVLFLIDDYGRRDAWRCRRLFSFCF